MKKSIFLILSLFSVIAVILIPILTAFPAWSASKDADQFKKFNPDIQKYEFVRNYLTGLEYLQQNARREIEASKLTFDDLKKKEKIEGFKNDIVLNNFNLRIARNLLKRYKTADNGLMLKTTDVFSKVCDEQIGLNNAEKKIIENLFKDKQGDDVTKENFFRDMRSVAEQRKESLKKLLEASLLVNKVLVSEKTDQYGEFFQLGVTKKERTKLIEMLDAFQGEEFKGGVRPGQTFIQGSVAAIRQILEDRSWGTLDI